MNRCIEPGCLQGHVLAPASKSAAHRAVLCAALAKGTSRVDNVWDTQDMRATAECVQALGANIVREGNALLVTGISSPPAAADLPCNESGSTLRFLAPIAAALGVQAAFFGKGRLPERPMQPLLDTLAAHGVQARKHPGAMFALTGHLQSGVYTIAGDISSQYITGLLFALPLLPGDSRIVLTSPLQSRGYVDLTLQMLAHFGVQVHTEKDGYRIPGGQRYRAADCTIEGDYSAAAFWLCAGALGSCVTVQGLRHSSAQGDREIVPILQKMGAIVTPLENGVHAEPGALRAVSLEVSQIPDLVPVLAATAAYAQGTTILHGAARLRMKESDRLFTIADGLRHMGADVHEHEDRLVIAGKPFLEGGCTVEGYGDHRIPMALSVAALRCRKPVTIRGTECVSKSYKEFFEDFQKLGGRCHVVELGK